MSHQIEKPFTDTQRADFICQYQGMKYAENDTAIYFLEAWETLNADGTISGKATDTDYKLKISATEKSAQKFALQAQIDEFDKKRIRAICEPSVKDASTGQTWLEYYNLQIQELRNQINELA